MSKEIEKRVPRPDVFSDFDRLVREMSTGWFEPFGVGPLFPSVRSDGTLFRAARTDVSDTGAAFRIVAEVPGIPKDKLDIRIRGTTVEIRGESSQAHETKGAAYMHRERAYHGYYRTLELPEPVVAADATAKVENGLLELDLPKQNPNPGPAEVQVRVA